MRTCVCARVRACVCWGGWGTLEINAFSGLFIVSASNPFGTRREIRLLHVDGSPLGCVGSSIRQTERERGRQRAREREREITCKPVNSPTVRMMVTHGWRLRMPSVESKRMTESCDVGGAARKSTSCGSDEALLVCSIRVDLSTLKVVSPSGKRKPLFQGQKANLDFDFFSFYI